MKIENLTLEIGEHEVDVAVRGKHLFITVPEKLQTHVIIRAGSTVPYIDIWAQECIAQKKKSSV